MSSISPFLLVATMVAAFAAAGVTQAQAPRHAAQHPASLAQLRAAAGHASSISSGVLVLAAR